MVTEYYNDADTVDRRRGNQINHENTGIAAYHKNKKLIGLIHCSNVYQYLCNNKLTIPIAVYLYI